MTVRLVVSVIVAAMFLVAVVGTARMAWRTFHDNEEMVPGGSWGDQYLGGGKSKGAPGKRKSRWRRKRRVS